MIQSLRSNFHQLQANIWLGLSICLAVLTVNTVHAQLLDTYTVQPYKLGTTTDEYTSLATSTQVSSITQGNAGYVGTAMNLPIGFTFYFNSQPYTQFNMSAKGYISFGSNVPTEGTANPINAAGNYQIIAPFASHYYKPGNTTFATNNPAYAGYFLDESAGVGNRILKVEWKNLVTNVTNATTDLVAFQVWLYESDGKIEIYIKAKSPGANSGTAANAALGIRSGSADQSLAYRTASSATAWNTTTAGASPFLTTEAAPSSVVSIGGANTANNVRQVQAYRKYVFTPKNCLSPTSLETSNVLANGFTLDFTYPYPAPLNGVDYEVIDAANNVVQSGNTTSSTIVVSGLNQDTDYRIRLRSNCDGSTSSWATSAVIHTLCGAQDIPYYLGFVPGTDNFTVPSLPNCTMGHTIVGGTWQTVPSAPTYGFTSQAAVYVGSGTITANAWLFTGAVNLEAGKVYRMSFKTGADAQVPTIVNKMRVAFGTSRLASSMTNEIINLQTIRTIEEVVATFQAPSTGVYYFGFHAYSAPNMGRLYLDDILVEESQCFPPTTFSTANMGSTSGMILWNSPTIVPAAGYEYYITTNPAEVPTYSTLPTGQTAYQINLASLSGLNPNTTYYVFIRGKCGESEASLWSTQFSFTTDNSIPPASCNPAPSSVDGQGITNVSIGAINNTTGAEPGNYGNYTHLVAEVPIGDTVSVLVRFQTNSFDYNCRIWVDWNGNGAFDSTEEVFYGMSYATAVSTIEAIFTIPNVPLGEYRMRIGGADINNLSGYGPGVGPCYNGTYGTFEDYTLKVLPARLPLAITQVSSAQCAGQPSVTVNITPATIGNYDVYEWTPSNGVTGNPTTGYTFASPSTTVYTLTGYQTSPPYNSNSTTFTYLATEVPTPIVITPSASAACPQGAPVKLTATGGVISGVSAREQNFNTYAAGAVTLDADWVISGVANAGRFTVRQDSWNPGNANAGILRSPTQTNFLISNSDGTGSGVTTNTKLSTTVNLASFTTSMLSFNHTYRRYLDCVARVNIRGKQTVASAFTPWQNLLELTSQTVGTKTSFVFQQIDISAYAGYEVVEIEFHYTSTWGWHWAIDDIKISGSAGSVMTWSPITDLYLDAAGTIPYAGEEINEVYALPPTTQTYIATSTSTGGVSCETSASITLDMYEIDPGVLPDGFDLCDGIIPDITLEDYNGDIIGWEISPTADFSSAVTYIPYSDGVETMTAAILGPVTSTIYLRAMVETAYCNSVSEPVQLRVETTSWNGTAWSNGAPTANKMVVFNGNYTSSGNLEACGVVVNSGNVVFNAGHSLVVQNAVTVQNAGSLTFENNSALVQYNDLAVNAGNITYKRNTTPIRRYDYTYWSAPVSPLTLANISPLTLADKYFEYNTTVGDWSMVPSSTSMVKGKGYIIRGPQTYSTTTFETYYAQMVGVPHNGQVTVPITYGGSDLNLMGNPYPSAIDADQLLLNYAVNSNVLAGTLYFWTHNTNLTNNNYDEGDYATYTLTGGVSPINPGNGNSNEPDGTIAAGQGFFANATTTGGTIVLDNSYRLVGNNNRFYRTTESAAEVLNKHRYWLALKDEAAHYYRQVLVGYISQATNAKDTGFDGDLLPSNDHLQVYTLIGNDKLAIQGRSLPFDPHDTVQLGYKVSSPGTYTFEWVKHDGLFLSQVVYIEDTLTGSIVPLTANSSYSFTTLAGEFNDRFILRYTNSTLGNSNWDASRDVIVYRSNDGLQLKATLELMQTVRVYDLQGRLLASVNNATATNANWLAIGATQQVLVVEIETTTGEKITRKVAY